MALTRADVVEKAAFRETTDLLQGAGVTRAAVAAHFGITTNAVSRWRNESDRLRPRSDWRRSLTQLACYASVARADQTRKLVELTDSLSVGAVGEADTAARVTRG